MKSSSVSLTKIITLFFAVFAILPAINATNYYVSNSGNDNNAGTIAEPWQTIDKVNTSMSLFVPGDSILFKRGDVFRGQITVTVSGALNNPIIFGAYGEGAPPVISGGKIITGWTNTSGNIYEADATGFGQYVRNFFLDYKRQPLSRFPKTGYRRITSVGSSSFGDATLTSPDNTWNGADVVIKTQRWVLDRLPIVSQVSGIITYSGRTSYGIQDYNGYFILNHINAITQEGEWAYNATSHKFYFYLPLSVNMGSAVIEAAYFDNAFKISGEDNIVIQNLDIKFLWADCEVNFRIHMQ